MGKKFKKVSVILLLISILFTIMAVLPLQISAVIPPLYQIGTWTGSGSASITIEIGYTAFVRLADKNGDVDHSNYTITGNDSNTVITFKEDYLCTLTNGSYFFTAFFAAEGLGIYTTDLHMKTDTEASFPKREGTDDLRLVKIMRGEEEIDGSNYSVITVDGVKMIAFKEEYLETLNGECSFQVYVASDKASAVLSLSVEKQITNTEVVTTVPTEIATIPDNSTGNGNNNTTESINIPTEIATIPDNSTDNGANTTTESINKSPQTGEHIPVAVWLVLFSSLIIGVIARRVGIKRENEE